MATSNQKLLFWRGTREAFNALREWNPWTHYTVKEKDGHWNEFYGVTKLSSVGGQLEPVLSVVASIGEIPSHKQGDRYLIGDDETTYYVLEIGPSESGTDGFSVNMRPLGTYSVRVLDRGGKEYQYVDGKLITYNDVDCGTYSND